MIGIYKITSPSGKIYIGQSYNIENRFKSYSKLRCEQQFKLYNSLKKYGFYNHKFNIIEECLIEELNLRERYWQDYYNVLEFGLNLILTKTDEKRKVYSEEVIKRISESNKKKHIYKSEESLNKTKETRFKLGCTINNKKVINTLTGEIFDSAKICHKVNNISCSVGHFRDMMSGLKKNKTNFKYFIMSKERNILIACYGTLRAGCGNNAYFLSEAEHRGTFNSEPIYSMFSLGGFPGLKNDGQTSIVLDVYAVNDDEATNIDALEGYSPGVQAHFYDKQNIETPWGTAGIYIYVRPTEGRDLIESGDWLNKHAKVVVDGVD